MKLIRLPLRLASVLIGLSSVVTHLLASVFLLGAVAGWFVHAQSRMVWQAAGIGLFFAFAPNLATWLMNRVTDCVLRILSFMLSWLLIPLPCASCGNHLSRIGNRHVWR